MENQTRNIAFSSSSESSGPRNHLLSIAIDRYTKHPTLSNAVRDAKAIVNVLTKRFDFEADEGIKELYDERGTREELYKALLEYQRTLTKADSLLIWFGGHGSYNPDTESGHWLPVNASTGESASLEWIEFDWLLRQLTGIRAGQIALIADSCHSGAALQGIVAGGIRKKENLPAPWILTSGRCDESVSDGLAGGHSPFAQCLLECLEQYNEPTLLFPRLEEVVLRKSFSRKQQPCCRQISGAGEGSGQYVFRLRENLPAKTGRAVSEISPLSMAARLRSHSGRYYQRLRNGRFKLLNISDLILTEGSPRFFDSTVRLDREEGIQNAQLPDMLRRLWKPEIRNVLLMGDGGMGKTVASVRLWEQWKDDLKAPIPMFISLNEYNAVTPDEERTFLRDSLFRHYLDIRKPSPDEESIFWNLLEMPQKSGTPVALLMLDGLNEVTREKGWLEKEIRDFMERCQGVQLLITTRYDLRNFTILQHFEKADLQPLRKVQIEDYLSKEGKTAPVVDTDRTLWALLGNPMMLTLYATTGEWVQKCRHDERFQFKDKAETTGELLWNFTEAQFAKLHELTPETGPDIFIERCDFFLRFLVPWIGFQMETQGQFILPESNAHNPEFNFEKLIREGFLYFDKPDFFRAFHHFRIKNKEKALLMVRNTGWESDLNRFDLTKTWLCEHLRLFVQEGDSLRFAHQNFRDFFAACHLRNSAEIALAKREIPITWKERTLPVYLRRILSDIEGDYRIEPFWDERTNDLRLPPDKNLITRILDQCRDVYGYESVGLTIWNLVHVMLVGRKSLVGVDLSRIDIRNIPMNGVQLSISCSNKYLATNFKNSIINGSQLIFKGHESGINSVNYNLSGKKFITASDDGTMKEYSIETGECLQTFRGHKAPVMKSIYSPDGEKVISVSWDEFIMEWSLVSNKCLNVFKGHGTRVVSVDYNCKGDKIVTASLDGTIKEWSVITGECIQTFEAHGYGVNCVAYSSDGEKVLSGSRNGGIEEWSVNNGNCIRQIIAHAGQVFCVIYSPDGNKIASASSDSLIKEWSVETGKCIQTINAHAANVNNLVYSSNGDKIFSVSNDQTMKKWSIISGECLQTFFGHKGKASGIDISPDGQRIITASSDGYVKEWALETGECLQDIKAFKAEIISATYNKNNKRILISSKDGVVKEWSVLTGICVNSIKTEIYNPISALYSDNGQKIILLCLGKTLVEFPLNFFQPKFKSKSIEVNNLLSDFMGSTQFSSDGSSWIRIGNTTVSILKKDETPMIESEEVIKYDMRIEKESIMSSINPIKSTSLVNEIGLLIQSVDFRNLHPDSHFTDEEKERLRRYGAIFDDEDEKRWNEAVADAYGEEEEAPD